MNEFKPGDILVSLKEQKSSDREDPVVIPEGYISENVCTDPVIVFFKETIPTRGSYSAENFRLATDDEASQYIKGRKVVEPECPYEEGDYITTTKVVESLPNSTSNTLTEGVTLQIDGIIKNKDLKKAIMYFVNIDGYYPVLGPFRKATTEEINNINEL